MIAARGSNETVFSRNPGGNRTKRPDLPVDRSGLGAMLDLVPFLTCLTPAVVVVACLVAPTWERGLSLGSFLTQVLNALVVLTATVFPLVAVASTAKWTCLVAGLLAAGLALSRQIHHLFATDAVIHRSVAAPMEGEWVVLLILPLISLTFGLLWRLGQAAENTWDERSEDKQESETKSIQG